MDALERELYPDQPAEPDYIAGQGSMDALERELENTHPPDQPQPISVSDRRPAGRPQPSAEQPELDLGPPVQRPGFFPQLVEGFRGGMEGQNVRATGQFTQDLAAALESERLKSIGQSIEAAGAKREHPASVKSLRDIHSLDDAGAYAGYQVGQGVASSLPSLAAGLAGAAAGGAVGGPIGAAVGAAAGAAGTSYVQNEGDISQELEELGMVDEKARAANAMRIAVPVAALDVIPTGRLLRILTGGRAPQEVAKRGVLYGLKRIAIETGKQGLTEGATEGIQEAMQGAGTARATAKPIDALGLLERSVEASVAGGLSGAAMGGGAQAYHEAREGLRGQSTGAPGAPPPIREEALPTSPSAPEGPSSPPPAPSRPVDQLLDDTPTVSEQELEPADRGGLSTRADGLANIAMQHQRQTVVSKLPTGTEIPSGDAEGTVYRKEEDGNWHGYFPDGEPNGEVQAGHSDYIGAVYQRQQQGQPVSQETPAISANEGQSAEPVGPYDTGAAMRALEKARAREQEANDISAQLEAERGAPATVPPAPDLSNSETEPLKDQPDWPDANDFSSLSLADLEEDLERANVEGDTERGDQLEAEINRRYQTFQAPESDPSEWTPEERAIGYEQADVAGDTERADAIADAIERARRPTESEPPQPEPASEMEKLEREVAGSPHPGIQHAPVEDARRFDEPEEPVWHPIAEHPEPKYRKKEAWEGPATVPEAPWVSDGKMAFRRADVPAKHQKHVFDSERDDGRSGIGQDAIDKVLAGAREGLEGKKAEKLEVLGRKDKLPTGQKHRPGDLSGYTLLAGKKLSVVVNTQKFNLLRDVTKFDELRGFDPEKAIGAYRNGELVGVLMPLRHEGREEAAEQLRSGKPPAPKPKPAVRGPKIGEQFHGKTVARELRPDHPLKEGYAYHDVHGVDIRIPKEGARVLGRRMDGSVDQGVLEWAHGEQVRVRFDDGTTHTGHFDDVLRNTPGADKRPMGQRGPRSETTAIEEKAPAPKGTPTPSRAWWEGASQRDREALFRNAGHNPEDAARWAKLAYEDLSEKDRELIQRRLLTELPRNPQEGTIEDVIAQRRQQIGHLQKYLDSGKPKSPAEVKRVEKEIRMLSDEIVDLNERRARRDAEKPITQKVLEGKGDPRYDAEARAREKVKAKEGLNPFWQTVVDQSYPNHEKGDNLRGSIDKLIALRAELEDTQDARVAERIYHELGQLERDFAGSGTIRSEIGNTRNAARRKAKKLGGNVDRPASAVAYETSIAEKGSTPQNEVAPPVSVESDKGSDSSKEPAPATPPSPEEPHGPLRDDLAGRAEASPAADVPGAAAVGRAGEPREAGGGDGDRGGGGDSGRADAEGPAEGGRSGPSREGRPASARSAGSSDQPDHGAVRRAAGRVAGENYRLTDQDHIGEGTPTAKVEGNLAAIKLLKEIEAAGRPATRDEQAVLAKYVGWGGLADAFDPRKPMGAKYGAQLAELLTPDELESAKASTPNAHYTSVRVIRAIFDALKRMGLDGGKLLEPAMGVGNFVGLTPREWRAQWSGVELDAITGRIGKLLYPKAAVRVNGFESVEFPASSFDAIISNVPFGNYPVNSRAYERKGKFLTRSIHNFYFAKALDLVRPGGIVAFITSRYTLDERSELLRGYLAEKADFLGAIRLPSQAFKENADTEVVTDVIFLRRKDPKGPAYEGPEWREVSHVIQPGNEWVDINEYYKDRLDQIVGTLHIASSRFGKQPTVSLPAGADFDELLEAALAKLPNGVYTPQAIESPATSEAAEEAALEAPGDVKEGGFALVDGKLYQRLDGKLRVADVPAAARDRVTRQTRMIEMIRGLIQAERLDRPDADVETRRKKLREEYRAFVKKYGPVTKETRTSYTDKNGKEIVKTAFPNLKIIREDPGSSFLFALEHDFDIDTGKAEEGGILSHRTVKPERAITTAATPADALPYVLNEAGRVDLEKIGALTGQTADQVGRELFDQGLIYDDPASTEWVPADEYLSGNVRAKLAVAREAEKREPRYRKHREALEKVIPEDLTPGQIHVAAGAPWIPAGDVEDFVNHLAGGNISPTVRYLDHDGSWHIKGYAYGRAGAQADWGTDRIEWLKVVELAFNNKAPVITDPGPPGGPERVKNIEATAAAEAKWQAVKDKFAQWIWEDGKRADRLARFYNDNFNNIRLWEPDGSHLTFPGMTKTLRGQPFTLAKHQRDAAWRIVRGGNTLLAHVVGAGKTFTMQAAGMEAKRLGLAKKPVYVVPNHLLGQFAREFRELYPSAQLLIAETEDVGKEGRARFAAKVTGSNWDGIIITHSSFEKISMSLEYQTEFLREQMRELETIIRDEKESGNRKSDTVKDVEKAKKRLEAKMKKLAAEWKKDDHLEFEALGLDMLFVDEAHLFKNLWIASRRRGVAMDGSQRAFDLYLKTRYLDQQRPGWGANFATGTPIANSVGEMFTMQRYLQHRLLTGRGLRNFDGWASTFGEDVTGLEMKPDGSGYRMHTRFARFKNVPELIQMFRMFADVKLAEDLNLPVPKLHNGKPEGVVSKASWKLKEYIKSLLQRAKELGGKDPSEDNWLKIVGDGRHAALDIRFVDTDPEADPQGKVAKAADHIAELWESTREHKGTQLVFSDLGTPKEEQKKPAKRVVDEDGVEIDEAAAGLQLTPRGGIQGFNVYDAIKRELVARGIPAHEIAFIHEANTEPKKIRLFHDMNSGKVRVLIGSTSKLGAGTNVQQRLVALHHLDAPWRPADVEQREGRILRQGNKLYNEGKIAAVRIYRYVTEESFDAFMWSTLERKAYMIAQVMKGDLTVREIEDLDAPVVADFAQMKAITSGNPAVMEKVKVDADVQKLDRQKKAHLDQQFRLRQELLQIPKRIEVYADRAAKVREDLQQREDTTGDAFTISLDGKEITKRPDAGVELRRLLHEVLAKHAATFSTGGYGLSVPVPIGSFAGYHLSISTMEKTVSKANLRIEGVRQAYSREIDTAQSPVSILSTLEHMVRGLEDDATHYEELAERERQNQRDLEQRVGQPFDKQEQLDGLLKRQAELNAMLTKQVDLENGSQASAEEDEDGDGTELRHSFPGGLSDQLRDLLERKRQREQVLAPFPEEIEESWQRAKGLQEATLREQFQKKLQEVRESLRHFGKIDPTAGPLEARANEILLEVEGAQSWAQAQAIHQIREVIKGLTEPEVDLLTRHFALNDLEKDVEAGLYEGKELPFFDSPAALSAALAGVRQAVSENPKVARAIHARNRMAQAMTEQLVAADQLPAKVLDDPRYYHRQVLEYFNALPPQTQRPGTSAQEMRVHQKGFQKARVGGGAFNTAYHQAEFEWLAQAHRILHMVEKLEELKQLGDVRDRLKAEAKQLNAAQLAAMAPEQVKEALEEYGQKMGRATAELVKLALDGKLTLPGFESMLAQLAEQHAEWRAQPRRKPGEGPRPAFRFSHPQWFSFLKRLLEQGGEGRIQAAVIFKALHEREEKVKELLGRQYRTWEDLIPDGYRIWQPVKGNHFFQALGVAERALQQYLAGERPLVEADFREMLVLGPAREQWVIPTWMADTMDGFGKKRDTSAFGRAWVYLENQWKRWQLLNPVRLLKYNFNNLSGDFDASLLAPGIHRYTRKAVADLWAYRKGTASAVVTEEIHQWMKLRVIDQGMTVVEIPDLDDVAGFEHLADPNPFRFMYWVHLYWRKARGLTLFRENILRLAAARHYFDHPNATALASNRKELQHIKDPLHRAAKLSRDLIGDYGNISEAGQWARERLFPFFSWQEINAKRYVNVIRNLPTGGDTKAGLGFLGKRSATYLLRNVLRLNAFFLMVALWNRLFWPDEDDELRERGRNLHLILGRYKDGSIRSIRIEGAWADFLEWAHLHDYPADVKDLVEGRRSVMEKVQEMARSPIEKIVGLWEPVSKTLFETLTKKATYPTPFDTRPIRDRWEHVAGSLSLQWLYREVTGKPNPPGSGYTQFLLMRTDPGEAAYFGLKQRVSDWQAKHGKERSVPTPTERDNALYYWRKALEWGEEDKADRWLKRYYNLGGTPANARQSIKRAAPLKELNEHDRRLFLRDLDNEGREMLTLAQQWYRRGLRATSGPSQGRTRPTPKGAP